MRGLNFKETMSKSNMNQQGFNIATYWAGIKDSNVSELPISKTTFRILRTRINI